MCVAQRVAQPPQAVTDSAGTETNRYKWLPLGQRSMD